MNYASGSASIGPAMLMALIAGYSAASNRRRVVVTSPREWRRQIVRRSRRRWACRYWRASVRGSSVQVMPAGHHAPETTAKRAETVAS